MTPRYQLLVFLLFSLCLRACVDDSTYAVKTKFIEVKSIEDIAPLTDSLVRPVLYSKLSGFDKLSSSQARIKFIEAVLPSILVAKHEIITRRKKLERLRGKDWSRSDSMLFNDAKLRFGGRSLEDVLSNMGTLPNSIVLAQAAIETGWGESRFFTEANNMFGIWSLKLGDDRIEAAKARKDRKVFVKAYDDLSHSITDYFEVLCRAKAYRQLRKARMNTDNPYQLVSYLKNYSEQGDIYTAKLRKIIRQNNLTKYDRYRLHPDDLVQD
jgi:Bax protein